MFKNILESNQAKIVLILGLISIFITTIKYLNLKIFVMHFLLFLYLIHRIHCNIFGKCYFSVYMSIVIAFIITTFLICDYFGIFKNYKIAIRRLYHLFQNTNNSHIQSNIKQIILPRDCEVSDYYKNRKIPKIVNKDFENTNYDDDIKDADEFKNKTISDLNSISTKYFSNKN